jgi:hypothetical protein
MRKFLLALGIAYLITLNVLAQSACEPERQRTIEAWIASQEVTCGRGWGTKSPCTEESARAFIVQNTSNIISNLKELTQAQRVSIVTDYTAEVKILKGWVTPISHPSNLAANMLGKFRITDKEFQICLINGISGTNQTSNSQNQQNQPNQLAQQPSAQQTQSSLQQSQAAQQQSQQAQQQAQQTQTRADQARQGQRRRHEPENEASQCIQPDFGGLYGGMKNTCDFKVWYTYCGYRPKESSWLTGMSCEKQSFGSDSVSPGRTSASHTKGVESIHWIACKEPAWALDAEFVPGQGIKGRCYTVGGK